ncbi:MAG: FUSC family protein [Bdellovibrionota bacterium]
MNLKKFFNTLINFKIIEIRQGWRAGIVCALCVFIEKMWIKTETPGWIIFTAFSCVQASVGATIRKSKQRFLGTCISCLLVFIIYYFFPKNYILFIFILTIGLTTAMYYISSYVHYVVFFTMAALMIYLIIYPNGSHFILLRIEDVGIGIIFGTLGSLLLWPNYAKSDLNFQIELSTNQLKELFQLLRDWVQDEVPLEKVLAQKELCANQNQSVREKLVEIRQEVRQKKFQVKPYENFMWSQERILYMLLMIFNSIRSDINRNHQDKEIDQHNLKILQQMYEIKIKNFYLCQNASSLIQNAKNLLLENELNDLKNKMLNCQKRDDLFERLFIDIQHIDFKGFS